MSTFHFSLVAPERELLSQEVEEVIVPGGEGDFGVLPGHAPFMATLRAGALVIKAAGEQSKVFVRGGFADVTPEGLTVLAEEAAMLADLSPEQVSADLESARAALANADEAGREQAAADVARLEAMAAALADTTYA